MIPRFPRTTVLARLAAFVCSCSAVASATAQFSVTSPTTDWQVVQYRAGLVTDYITDQQTGSGEADIVGNGILPSFYTKFIAGATSTTGTAYYRVRLGADDSPSGFKGACFLGVDANNDGMLDVFFGVDNSGSSNGIYIWNAGSGLNTSPSTTSIDSNNPTFTYSPAVANYSWRIVDSTIDPSADTAAKLNTDGRSGGGQTDYFISFAIPFADIVQACQVAGVPGVTSSTTLRYVIGTATQANAFNQDLNGVNGGLSSSTGWDALGVFSLPLNVSGQITANAVPVAVNDTATTNEDTAVNVAVLGNDTDGDGDALTVTGVSQSPNGVVTFTASNVTFAPAANYFGTTSFTYTISDGKGGTATATVTMTVNAVNDAPSAANDSATTNEDAAVTVPVLTNDTDIDGDTLSVTSVTQPANGAVIFTASGVIFTPRANFNGVTTFTYTISDGNGATATATVTMTVASVNDSPVAVNDSITTNEDASVTISVLGNDTDLDGDTLAVTGVAQSAKGAVTFTASGVTFTPSANFNGVTTFTYTISDGHGGSATATVTVTVAAVNDSPVAVNDSASTAEDTAVAIPVVANDTDSDGDTLVVTGVTQSANGSVTYTTGGVTFTPAAEFHGAATFTYTIGDAHGGTATAAVTVTVTAVNDRPVAQNDVATTNEDEPVSISVLANDSDVDGDVLTISAVTQSGNGTVTFTGSKVSFAPAANYHGTATFTYTVSDGSGGTATASVTVTVLAVNDDPVAENDSAVTAEDEPIIIAVLANDSDLDGDTLSVDSVTQSVHGSVIIAAGAVRFTPEPNFNGVATFTYTVSDGNGATGTATVSVTVTPVNDSPTAQDDLAATNEDTAVTTSVLVNDTDLDGDTLAVQSVTQSAKGVVTFSAAGVTFTPEANFNGITSFTYTVSDSKGGNATATVTVDVAAVNDAPVAQNDAATTSEDAPVSIAVLANDSDDDGDAITVSSVTQSTHGQVTFTAAGVNFTPAENFNGTATFSYTIADGKGGTATAAITVTVTAQNDPPVAIDDIVAATEDIPVSVKVLANDTDLDGDALTVTSAVLASGQGTADLAASGAVTFIPARNFNGVATIAYSISDGKGGAASANVIINVAAVNDQPVAVNDTAITPEGQPVVVNVLPNDSDVEGSAIHVKSVQIVSGNGTASITPEGEVRFVPGIGFIGSALLTYTVEDAEGGIATAFITIDVNGLPLANADYAVTQPGKPVLLDVLSNDVDPEGAPLVVIEATIDPLLGSFVIGLNGQLTYTPAASSGGAVMGEYSVRDTAGNIAKAKIFITVSQVVIQPPAALPDTAQTPAGQPVRMNLLFDDTDPSGSPLVLLSVDVDPATGSVTPNSDGTITFTPAPGFRGTAILSYVMKNSTGQLAGSSALITVAGENNAPLPLPDVATAAPATTKLISVLGNDVDPDGDMLSLDSVQVTTGGGTATIVDGRIQFIAPESPQFVTLTYTVRDNAGATASTTVTITVASDFPNSLPVALNDSARTSVGETARVNVLQNDSDPDGDSLVIVGVSVLPEQGSVTFSSDGLVTFVPAPGFNGTAVISYSITDGNGGTTTATLTVNVNDNPVAVTDFAKTLPRTAVTVDALGNDFDPNGNPLTVIAATADPLQGALAIETDARLRFTPATGFTGIAQLSYTIIDGKGGTAEGSVFINVNTPPVAATDDLGTTIDKPSTISVLSNDSDADTDNLVVVGATVDPAQGTVVVNPNGTITFTPAATFSGTATITYTIVDSKGSASTGRATVRRDNAAPTAETRRVYTYCETPILINPLRTTGDVDNETLRVVQVGKAGKGTVKLRSDGMLLYTPNKKFSGKFEDSFTVLVSDPNGSLVETVIRVNAFSAIAGRFEGMLIDREALSNAFAPAYRGRITMNLTGRATFSAKIEIDGTTKRLVGELTGALHFERKLRVNGEQVLLSISYDDMNDRWNVAVSGRELDLVNGTAVARVSKSDRSLAGRYVASLSGTKVGEPATSGSGDLRIRKNGAVSIVGWLPDGKAFSDSTSLTNDGELPIYAHGIAGVLKGSQSAESNAVKGVLLWNDSGSFKPLNVAASHAEN